MQLIYDSIPYGDTCRIFGKVSGAGFCMNEDLINFYSDDGDTYQFLFDSKEKAQVCFDELTAALREDRDFFISGGCGVLDLEIIKSQDFTGHKPFAGDLPF